MPTPEILVIDRGIFEYGEIPSAAEGAREEEHLNHFTGDNLPTSRTKEDRPAVDAERGELSMVKAIFEKMPSIFNADAAKGVDATFQFNITGEGGGDWYAEVKAETCKVEAGVHPNPTTTHKDGCSRFRRYDKWKVAGYAGLHIRQAQNRRRHYEGTAHHEAVQILRGSADSCGSLVGSSEIRCVECPQCFAGEVSDERSPTPVASCQE